MSASEFAPPDTVWRNVHRRKSFSAMKVAPRPNGGLGGSNQNRFACLNRDDDFFNEDGCQMAPLRSRMCVGDEGAAKESHPRETSRTRRRGIRPYNAIASQCRTRHTPPLTEVDEAYAALGGMEDSAEFVSLSPDGAGSMAETIAESIRRRLASGPLENVQQRPTRPTTDYDRLMKYIDNVALEVGRSRSESDGALSRFVRVSTLAKILYAQLNSEQPHQCVVEECFAVCVLEVVARPHADGLYERRQTSWEKVDGKALMTHSMKLERVECAECVSGFFFSIFGSEVGQAWGAVSAELARCRRLSVADGSNVLDSWRAKRAESIRAKEHVWVCMGCAICEELRLGDSRRRISAPDGYLSRGPPILSACSCGAL